tara:strand:- start:208 stop:504 length:297 start_codon:yes stop_codon:yes gene_type:complete
MKAVKKSPDGRNVQVELDATNRSSQKRKKDGTVKAKRIFKESSKSTDLDSGNVTTLKTRSNSNTGKYKQVFKEKDADGKLIAKQVDKNGKTRVPKRFQ